MRHAMRLRLATLGLVLGSAFTAEAGSIFLVTPAVYIGGRDAICVATNFDNKPAVIKAQLYGGAAQFITPEFDDCAKGPTPVGHTCLTSQKVSLYALCRFESSTSKVKAALTVVGDQLEIVVPATKP